MATSLPGVHSANSSEHRAFLCQETAVLVLGKRPYKWQREAIMVDDGRAKLKNEVIARPKQHASSQIRALRVSAGHATGYA